MTESIKRQYPLHWNVWNNDYIQLDAELKKNRVRFVQISRFARALGYNFLAYYPLPGFILFFSTCMDTFISNHYRQKIGKDLHK